MPINANENANFNPAWDNGDANNAGADGVDVAAAPSVAGATGRVLFQNSLPSSPSDLVFKGSTRRLPESIKFISLEEVEGGKDVNTILKCLLAVVVYYKKSKPALKDRTLYSRLSQKVNENQNFDRTLVIMCDLRSTYCKVCMRFGSRLKEKINCEITLLMDCDWGGSCVSCIINCQRSYGEHELVPRQTRLALGEADKILTAPLVWRLYVGLLLEEVMST